MWVKRCPFVVSYPSWPRRPTPKIERSSLRVEGESRENRLSKLRENFGRLARYRGCELFEPGFETLGMRIFWYAMGWDICKLRVRNYWIEDDFSNSK